MITNPPSVQLPAFPARPGNHGLSVAFEKLRFATTDDLPFLRKLYRSFRFDDLAPLPWSIDEKHAFLDQQFDMQHRYYVAVFPKADFLIIENKGLAIGRLYIDSSQNRWHIIDIGFLPEWRNQKLGQTLLREIQNTVASRENCSLTLHVERANIRAQAFYQTLGFGSTDSTDTHIGMKWPVS